MGGIGIILNPHSKKYKRSPEKLKRIGFIVGEQGTFSPTQDLLDLKKVAQEFKDRRIDILGITGGDGTNHRTLTTFIKVYGETPLPKITFLRGGTINAVANGLGIQGPTEGILSNILYKYHEDEPFVTREVPIMKINDDYGFIWGLGTIDRFLQQYYAGEEASSWKAAKILAQSIFSAMVGGPLGRELFERVDAEVVADGKRWPFKNYSALYMGAVHGLGLDFRVFYLVDKFPGKFHCAGYSMTGHSLFKFLPAMWLGVPCGSQDLLEEAVEEVTIRLAKPCRFTIDGDMHNPQDQFHISKGPILRIIIR